MGSPKKILIVEDEKSISRPLLLKLQWSGFEAKVASDGEEALQILAKEQFDLILLDIMMPKLDGFSTLTKIKEMNIVTPVIIASNLGQEEDINRAKQLGAIDYYIKSNVSLSEIVDHIKQVLQVNPGPPAA